MLTLTEQQYKDFLEGLELWDWEDEKSWTHGGMIIHTVLPGDDGLALWMDLSRRHCFKKFSDDGNDKLMERKWASFDDSKANGLTIYSVFKVLNEARARQKTRATRANTASRTEDSATKETPAPSTETATDEIKPLSWRDCVCLEAGYEYIAENIDENYSVGAIDGYRPDAWESTLRLPPYMQLLTALHVLYERNEIIGIVTENDVTPKGDPTFPRKISHVGEVEDALFTSGRLDKALGRLHPRFGAWMTMNPYDGKRFKETNLTGFRYALLESDDAMMTEDEFLDLLFGLRLDVMTVTRSAGKSTHAIVDTGIRPEDFPGLKGDELIKAMHKEYDSRVEIIHKVANTHGMKLDPNDKNPGHMTRLPGALRDGEEQSLLIIEPMIGGTVIDATTGEGLVIGNWSDWLEWAKLDSPEVFAPPAPPSVQPSTKKTDGGKNEKEEKIIPLEYKFPMTLKELPPHLPDLIEGLVKVGRVGAVIGNTKIGKSHFMEECAICLATGMDFYKMPVIKSKVLFVDPEMDEVEFAYDVKIIADNLLKGQPEAVRYDFEKNFISVHIRGKGIHTIRQLKASLLQHKDEGIKVIIIDSIFKFMGGMNENDNATWDIITTGLEEIAEEMGVTILYIHHTGKDGGVGGDARKAGAGHSTQARQADSIIFLKELHILDSVKEANGWKKAKGFVMETSLRYGEDDDETDAKRFIFRNEDVDLDEDGLLDGCPIKDSDEDKEIMKALHQGATDAVKKARDAEKKAKENALIEAIVDVLTEHPDGLNAGKIVGELQKLPAYQDEAIETLRPKISTLADAKPKIFTKEQTPDGKMIKLVKPATKKKKASTETASTWTDDEEKDFTENADEWTRTNGGDDEIPFD